MACVRTGETAAGCWAGLDPWPEGHTLDVLFIPGAMECSLILLNQTFFVCVAVHMLFSDLNVPSSTPFLS